VPDDRTSPTALWPAELPPGQWEPSYAFAPLALTRHTDVSALAYRIYLAIDLFAGERGIRHGSIADLQRTTHASNRAIRRAVQVLARLTFIEVERHAFGVTYYVPFRGAHAPPRTRNREYHTRDGASRA
jgi:hypothetical protein